MTGVTLTTGNAGLEGLLAGATLGKDAAVPPNAAVPIAAAPSGFADLLALLGVSLPEPLVEDAEAPESTTNAAIPLDATTNTSGGVAPIVTTAPPEQIAQAVIRAMLQGGYPRAELRVEESCVAEACVEGLDVKPPSLELPVNSEPQVQTDAPAPVRPNLEKPMIEVRMPVSRKSTKDEPEKLAPLPEIVPQTAPAAINAQPIPVATPIQIPAPALPSVPAPEPKLAVAVDTAPKIEAPVQRSSHAQIEVPQLPEVKTIEPQTAAAPVAFALRLTASEEVAPPVNAPKPVELPKIVAAPRSIVANSTKPETPSTEQAPEIKIAAQVKEAEQREPSQEQPTPRSEKPERVVAHETAPASPELHAMLTVAPAARTEGMTPAPVRQAAEAPSTADAAPVAQPAEPPKPTTAAHEIAVRVSAPNEAPIDLHLAQRGGEVRVAVRTPDETMQTSLRQDLGKLVDRLEQTGFRTEQLPVREATAIRLDRFNLDAGSTYAIHRSSDVSGSDVRGETSSHRDGRDRDTDPNQSGSRQQQQQQRRQQRQPKEAWEDFA